MDTTSYNESGYINMEKSREDKTMVDQLFRKVHSAMNKKPIIIGGIFAGVALLALSQCDDEPAPPRAFGQNVSDCR